MEKDVLENFISIIFETLVNTPYTDNNLIRKHTCKLEQLGEISFNVKLKNWSRFINGSLAEGKTIFSFQLEENDEKKGLEKLLQKLKQDVIHVQANKIINNSAHLFLNRTPLFSKIIPQVLSDNKLYGHTEVLSTKILLTTCKNVKNDNNSSLTALRLIKIKKVTENLIKHVTKSEVTISMNLQLSTHPEVDKSTILCGPVINESGVKEINNTSQDLFKKRIGDVRKMFEHKYGTQIEQNAKLQEYFEKLGKGCVTLELLTNKPHKTLKVDMKKDIESTKRDLLFVFYNCARIATLFKEYERKGLKKLYPKMPEINNVDFSLLREPEEWELFYVFILQYPSVIKSCIKDIEEASVNPQHLVTFLCSLSSVFSAYYRRVRILVDPREHLIPVIHARMYLLQALQCVFHNALDILDVEPIKEM